MEQEQSADEITQRIRDEGIKTANFRMECRDIRLTRLKSKVFYIKKLSKNELRIKSLGRRTKQRLCSNVETFKHLLMNIYISDSIIMAFTLRNIINQRALRATLDRIKTHKQQKLGLPYCLRELFKRKRINRMGQFFYRLSFQPKKKREEGDQTYISPRRRAMTTIQFNMPRKSLIFKPLLNPAKQALPNLLNSLHSNSSRQNTLYTFRLLTSQTLGKKWQKCPPLKNLCRIINSRLQPFFCNIYAFGNFNKKVIVPTLFNLDFKYAGLSADRIKQLNREIEEHSNTKLAMGRKHDRVATQLSEAIEGIEGQVGEWEQKLAESQGRMREVLAEEDRRRNRLQLDYYPILKKIFNEVEQTDLKVFRKVAILRKNNIQLNKLADWPQILLSINIKLRKQCTYYQNLLCPSTTIQRVLSPQHLSLQVDIALLQNTISDYVQQTYRYKILENLKANFSKLQKQYAQLEEMADRNDTEGIKKIFGML